MYNRTVSFTMFLSMSPVVIIMTVDLCSQIILQKSAIVNGSGPCVAMYALACPLYPCAKQ